MEAPMFCGEFQAVIAKLRQEGYLFSRLDDLGHGPQGHAGNAHISSSSKGPKPNHHHLNHHPSRSLFCLREPGLFVDVLQVSSAHELRKEAQGLMASACTAREKLRAYSSSCRENAAPDSMEILKPLLDIVVSASMSATATGEALATIHRMIVDMNILKSFESGSKAEIHIALENVINSVVECVFRQTESGDDEIAIMWALEVLEGCVQHEAAQNISEKTLERVFVTIYKNSIASSNADMLRRLAVRKLGAMVTRLYGSLYNSPSSSSPSAAPSYDLSSRMFSFLCRRIDPQNGNWHEMEARQASLELVHAALVATINIESDHEEEHGCILADKNPSIHSDINDSLFRALLQICQVAGRLIEEPSGTSGFGDGSDVVKVVSMSSLEELDENPDQTQTQTQNQNQDQNQDQDQPKEDANSSNTDNDTDKDKGNNTNDDKSEAGSNANNNKSSRNNIQQNKTNKKRSNPKDPFVKLPTSFAALEAQYLKISNSYHKNLDQDKSRGEPGTSMDSSSSSISTTQTSVTAVRMPLGILTRALRVVQLLIGHKNTRKFLKVQIQAFINSVFLRTLEAKPKSTDNEARRLVLETLTDLFADPSFSIDMYCNFDCSLNSSNVYENLFVYLSNHSFPKQLRKLALDTLQLMSLRCIHIGVKAISSRAGESLAKQPVSFSDKIYEPADLLKTKLAKRQLMTCAQEFNRKPKAGIAALVAAKIISDPPEPAQIAAFLRNTQGLDKEKIGEFLGATGDLSAAVLESFLKTFNMEKLPLLASLRMFLESFRLPKEAQQIDRVVQCFAEVAHLKCSDAKEFPTVDCTYLLTFSIILLNTDLHNPNIRPEKKMRFDQFKLNNTNYGQDVSQGKDMPAPLLRAIYDEIKVRQINTMSDGSSLTAEVTGDRWRDLMRIPSEMKLVVDGFHSSSSEVEKLALFRAYDKQMFAAIHKPAFAALSVVYHAGDPAKQPKAVEMALEGIMNCAEVSSRYGMVMVLDRIAVDVCKFTSLLTYAHISHSDDSDSDSGFYYGIEDDDDDEGNITDVDDEEDDDDDDDTTSSSSNNNNNINNNNNNNTSGSGGSAQDVGKQQNKAAVPPPQSPKGATSVSSNGRRSTNRENAPDVLGSRVKIQETLGLLQTSTKAQYAANAVLEIAHSHGSMLRLAWPHVVYCFLRLFDLDLLPLELLGESKIDNFIDPASRLKYHRAVAQVWLKDARSKVAQAMDALERSKGWVSWLSGESQKEAEALVRVQEEEMAKVEKAIKFAAASVSNLTSSDRDVQQSFTVRVIDRVKMDKVVSLVDDSKTFADNTLVAFVRGIVTSCCGDETICPTEEDILQDVTVEDFGEDVGESDARGDIRVDMLAPPSRASRLFGLHLLVEVALVNTERIHLVWQMVRSHLLKVLKSAKQPTCHTEKASVGLLRIALRLLVQGNSRSPVSDDLGGLFKYLLRIPNEIAPGFGALVSGALIRAFDSTDFKWNSAIAKTLIAISQLEEFGLVKNAAKILPKICSEPTMLDIPFGILIDVFKCYFCRACSHISNASRSSSEGSDGAQDLLIELLDLLYMIHSRILRGERDTWFESDLIVIECLIAITLGKVHDSIPPSVRSHSARLLLLIRDELPSLEKQKLEGLESFGQVLVAYPSSSTEVVSDASSSVPVEKKTTEQVESASDEKEEEGGGGEKVVEQEEKDASTNGNNDDDDDDDEQSLR